MKNKRSDIWIQIYIFSANCITQKKGPPKCVCHVKVIAIGEANSFEK